MGILLVYDVGDIKSFEAIANWMKNIDACASETVVRVLIGNKCDLEDRVTLTLEPSQPLTNYAPLMSAYTGCRKSPRNEEKRWPRSTELSFSKPVLRYV